jgi:putative flippase GtrA
MTPLVALPRLVWAAFGLLAVVTIAAVFLEVATRLGSGGQVLRVIAVCVGVLFSALVAHSAAKAARALATVGRRIESMPTGLTLATLLLAGLALRGMAAATLGPVITPDGGVYLGLADRLIEGANFITLRGDHGVWPPGYPLILGAARRVPGLMNPLAAIVAVNLLAYLVAAGSAFFIGKWLYGRSTGLAAAALVAFWPSLIVGASTSSKELALLGLISAAALLYIRARRKSGGRVDTATVFLSMGCGLVLGLAALVQPVLLPLPTMVLMAEILHPDSFRSAAARIGLVAIGVLLVVTPWLVRNAAELGIIVPIATAEDDTFYRSSKPPPASGEPASGSVILQPVPHGEHSQPGVRLALEGISREPHRFLALWWQRLLHFSGDDTASAREALRSSPAAAAPSYTVLVAAGNVAWLAIWVLIVVSVASGIAQCSASPGAWLLALAYLYAAAVNSLIESGPHDHTPFAGLLAVLAAAAIGAQSCARESGRSSAPRHPAIQFIDFAVVGAVGTGAHFVTLILLVQTAGWPPVAATTAGFLAGAIVNYALNYSLTFQSQAQHRDAMPRFLAIAFASMLVNVAIFWVLVHGMALHYLLAQIIATAVVLVVNFLANRALTFAPRRRG